MNNPYKRKQIHGYKVTITGAAGSLGRAFVKYLHKDNEVIALDNNEWALASLKNEYPDVKCILKDFVDYRFNQEPTQLLIHCGAYKHVDLGEHNPHSFIENNITKTGKLFAECFKHSVDFLFISTDKAVEPISTYGFTKALGEKLAWHYHGSVARLGNILNSTGSVIPVWEDAILHHKPIPITSWEMKRFVIEADDAVKYLWEHFLKGDSLIVPEGMKEEKLEDLLKQVLKKHNLEFADKFKIIGLRPGEKTREKLKWDYEE